MAKEEKPLFVLETERIYKTLENEISLLRQTEFSNKTDVKFDEIVISSYVKTYDFILFLCSISDYSHSFFYLPVLRGICEDLITLTYILDQPTPKQNFIIIKKRYEELNKSTSAQEDFFSKYNPGQIIPPIFNKNVEMDKIIEVHKNAGHEFEETNLPKVYKMAEKVNLKYLYDFLYHATSKAVHFDIFTLLSMGWGDIDESNETMNAKFSYKNDYKQYFKFCLFYSSYLFIKQTENFKHSLNLPASIENTLSEIETEYRKIDWPELVTFSHLNMKPPTEITRKMYRFMIENK